MVCTASGKVHRRLTLWTGIATGEGPGDTGEVNVSVLSVKLYPNYFAKFSIYTLCFCPKL